MIAARLALSTTTAVSQVVPVALVALLYAARARSLARSSLLPRWRQASFYAGIALIVLTLALLERRAEHSLSWSTVELLLIGDIATLLIVLGLTRSLIAPIVRAPFLGRLQALGNPLVAFPVWAANLFLWHLAALYEGALEEPGVQALEHLSFVLAGVAMWMCLFGPLARPRWFGHAARLSYAIAVRATAAIFANLLLWSGSVTYAHYVLPDTNAHVSPLVDQNIAGAIMLVESSVVAVLLLAWLYRSLPREAREARDARRMRYLAQQAGIALEGVDGLTVSRGSATGRERIGARRYGTGFSGAERAQSASEAAELLDPLA